MKNNTCSLRFKIIAFLVTMSIIAFAFIHSSMPSTESAQESDTVLEFVRNILNIFGLGDVLNSHSVRKLAHFVEYMALGVSLVWCAYSFNRTKTYRLVPYTVSAGLFTAVIDETIQLNVAGRAGMIVDVWLDFSGVLTGTIIMLAVFAIYIRIRKD